MADLGKKKTVSGLNRPDGLENIQKNIISTDEYYEKCIKQNHDIHLYNMARDQVFISLYKKQIKEQINKGLINVPFLEKSIQLNDFYHNYFITISFDDTLFNYDKIMSSITEFKNKSYILKCDFVFEQRSTDPTKFYGFHIHMFITCKKSYYPSNIKKPLVSCFGSFIGRGRKFIDIRPCITDNGIDNYMNGIKDDPEKQKKQIVDKIWLSQFQQIKRDEFFEFL